MKNCKLYILLTMMTVLTLTATAQRRGRVVNRPKVEEPVEDPRITQMRASTQQVVFVDSLVVPLNDFISHIPLSPHCGKLTQNAGPLGIFTNEMGDYRLQTIITADTLPVIAGSDFIANRWTEPTPIEGLGEAAANFPFLMPDGITLYFAQKGEKSIGGYDIFVTRYDSERGLFLRPENLGMPFASEANDYLYVIDEFNQLGYFVTDRRQPTGKVCIYTFIPTESRRTYDTEAYSDEELRSLALIGRIADTWGNGADRQEALARLETARTTQNRVQHSALNPQNSEIDTLRHQADVLQKALTLARNYYATASESEQLKLRDEILNSERQLELLLLEIRQKEKQIPYNN